MKYLWSGLAAVSGAATLLTLGIAIWRYVGGVLEEAAQWVMAGGGLALVSFALVELYLREAESKQRRVAALARLKPVARLARRSCERGVMNSDGQALNHWLQNWYVPPALETLQGQMVELVTRAAEAGGAAVKAADGALDEFIAAADSINEMAKTLQGAQPDDALRKANLRGREAAGHLAEAARKLEALAPRGKYEPAVPADAKFLYED